MAYQYVLMGVVTDSNTTTWPSVAELALTDALEPEDLQWNQDDWAGLSKLPEAIGEVLDAKERTLSPSFNALQQAGFTIGLDNPMAYEITSREAEVLVKVYEDGGPVPIFVGDCVGTEEVGSENGVSLKCTFANPYWRLAHRLCRKLTLAGVYSPAQPNVTWAATPPGTIISELLHNANYEPLDGVLGVADTGIRFGTSDVATLMTVGDDPPWNYKFISEALTEMAASGVSVERVGAFDFEIVPVEPVVDSLGLQIATLNVVERVGQVRPNVVFEFGDGSHSAREYKFIRDKKDIVNRSYAQGADPADDTLTVKGFHTASQATRGLFESLVPIDVGNQTLRQAWVDAVAQIRGEAFLRAEFTPAVESPQYGVDYFVGDSVRVRVRVNDVDRFDAMMRVYGVDISIDDNDVETVTPKLASE